MQTRATVSEEYVQRIEELLVEARESVEALEAKLDAAQARYAEMEEALMIAVSKLNGCESTLSALGIWRGKWGDQAWREFDEIFPRRA